MTVYEPRAAALAFAKLHADAVAALHTAQLNLKIFEATAFLGCDVGTIKERELYVQSDPGFKKLSTAVIKARREKLPRPPWHHRSHGPVRRLRHLRARHQHPRPASSDPPPRQRGRRMTFFLINLDRSPHRLAHMQAQADALGLMFERVPGIDGAANVPAWLADEFAGTPLSSGEVGCYASHLICAKMIVEREMPFAVILEDDVELEPDFMSAALKAAYVAPVGWDYIHLSTRHKRPVVHVADINGRKLVQHTRLPVNTAAYVLSNAGARKWLKPRQRVRPNDMDVRYAWLDDLAVFGVFPSPASQDNRFASDIGGTHTPTHRDPKRHWSPGLASDLYGIAWNMRRVGPLTLARAKVASWANSATRRGKPRTIKVLKNG